MSPPHHSAVPTGLVSLPKLHCSMYEAAWWVVTARSARIVEADALTHDWNLVFMHTLAPITMLWHPMTQTVETESASDDPEVDVLTRSWTEGYLNRLYSEGPDSAAAYSRVIEGWRADAREKLMSMCSSASTHDMQLAAQAEAVRKTLVLTKFAAEVAMAIIGVMIVFPAAASAATVAAGLGPVVVGTSTAAEAGWATAAISSLYTQAADLVKDGSQPQAVAVDCNEPMLRQVASRSFEKTYEHNVMTRKDSFKTAVKTVRTLNARIATTKNPITKVAATVERVPARFNVGMAKNAWEHARKLEETAHKFSNGAQVIFAGVDIYNAWRAFEKEWHA